MKNADESAFPQTLTPAGNPLSSEYASGGGLTKREEFARSAMQGILSCHGPDGWGSDRDAVALESVRMADSLLAGLSGDRQQRMLAKAPDLIALVERFAFIAETMPKPELGRWNWPQLAAEARALIASVNA